MTTRAIAPLTLALALAAAGCGTAASQLGPAYAKARATPKEDAALLYVYRYDAEPTDAPATLLLDGRELVDLQQRGFTWLYTAPGAHRLAVRWPQGSGQHPAEIGLDLGKGVPSFVELTGVHQTTGHGVMIASSLEQQPRDKAERRLGACGFQRPAAAAP